MAEIKTGGDAIRWYLTGASSDGGAQTNPNLSLGKNRAATQTGGLGITVSGGPANITVSFASGANGEGAGSVSSETTGSLAWTPPGGSKGNAVTIANGETKQLVGGGSHPEQFIIVSRTSATNLTGTATVTLADEYNAAVAGDNATTAEQAAGDAEYRCLAAKNESASTVAALKCWLKVQGTARAVDAAGYAASGAVSVACKTGNYDDWPAAGFVENDDTSEVLYYASRTSSVLTVPAAGRNVCGDGAAAGDVDDVLTPIGMMMIGKEAPATEPSGAFTDKTSAGEGSAPGGVTFAHPHSAADAQVINIGDLTAGYIYGLWVKKIIVAGATADADILAAVETTFEAL
jgi:hypothetical protein